MLILEYAFIEVRLHEDMGMGSVANIFLKLATPFAFKRSLTKQANCRVLKAA